MMNNEEIERKMNFIVEQQAQFASDIQLLQESQSRTEQVVARNVEAVAYTVEAVAQTVEVVAQTAESVTKVGDVVTRLANVMHEGFAEVDAKINALIDAQIRTEENLARTDANVARTDANVARTDANLNKLTSDVDRYLRGKNET